MDTKQLQADEHWLREFILDLRTLAYHAERHAEGVPTQVVRERAKQLEDRLGALLAAQGAQVDETDWYAASGEWRKRFEEVSAELRRMKTQDPLTCGPLQQTTATMTTSAAPPVQGAQKKSALYVNEDNVLRECSFCGQTYKGHGPCGCPEYKVPVASDSTTVNYREPSAAPPVQGAGTPLEQLYTKVFRLTWEGATNEGFKGGFRYCKDKILDWLKEAIERDAAHQPPVEALRECKCYRYEPDPVTRTADVMTGGDGEGWTVTEDCPIHSRDSLKSAITKTLAANYLHVDTREMNLIVDVVSTLRFPRAALKGGKGASLARNLL